tara:strand:- start:18046 stop:18834 length:789 start_codon:yes stop_codon:yes gene_type:complete
MNLKKIGLALAISAAAGSANAAFSLTSNDAGNTVGSSVVFAAYDSDALKTIYVNLGPEYHNFDLNANQSFDLSSAAAEQGVSLSNALWTIVAGDGFSQGGSCGLSDLDACGRGYMATVNDVNSLASTYSTYATSQALNGVNNGWFLNVYAGIDASPTDSNSVSDGNFGEWNSGQTQANSLWLTTGMTGETLGFAVASTYGIVGGRGASESAEANVSSYGSWSLDANGGLSYAVSAVPVPAAVWMFASGLVGMAGVARRRKQA